MALRQRGLTRAIGVCNFNLPMIRRAVEEKMHMPFLCIAGGSDELSPIENTMRLFGALPGPRQVVIYEESRHWVGGGVSCEHSS
jgi:pimeloyl-ACP methyl ester carboxylesterase